MGEPGRGKKLVDVWRWQTDRERIKYCQTCEKDFKQRGEKAPCKNCEYDRGPALLEINEEAMLLWIGVRTQWRSGSMGLIGLDYNVLYKEANRLSVDLSACNMKKIQALESCELKRQGEKHDRS